MSVCARAGNVDCRLASGDTERSMSNTGAGGETKIILAFFYHKLESSYVFRAESLRSLNGDRFAGMSKRHDLTELARTRSVWCRVPSV